MDQSNERVLQLSLSTVVPLDPTNPATTGVGVDTSFRFIRPAERVTVQNNTAAIAYVNFDAAATPGSFALAANGPPTQFYLPCKVVHLYTAAAQSVNGVTAAGIVVAGMS